MRQYLSKRRNTFKNTRTWLLVAAYRHDVTVFFNSRVAMNPEKKMLRSAFFYIGVCDNLNWKFCWLVKDRHYRCWWYDLMICNVDVAFFHRRTRSDGHCLNVTRKRMVSHLTFDDFRLAYKQLFLSLVPEKPHIYKKIFLINGKQKRRQYTISCVEGRLWYWLRR